MNTIPNDFFFLDGLRSGQSVVTSVPHPFYYGPFGLPPVPYPAPIMPPYNTPAANFSPWYNSTENGDFPRTSASTAISSNDKQMLALSHRQLNASSETLPQIPCNDNEAVSSIAAKSTTINAAVTASPTSSITNHLVPPKLPFFASVVTSSSTITAQMAENDKNSVPSLPKLSQILNPQNLPFYAQIKDFSRGLRQCGSSICIKAEIKISDD
ncbi:hypothetical protein KIN20_001161 [Parelaphostrongylus tenuis]|uniref:Uncharacterized protein n=1 Tax=Parelaphostrongylus tenuis TaxID=148309 RepID=A0AAD5MC72_PARTN|nr:hypothetical protein KIN20_001161 [Parelaphostrongylus tenuis]